MSHGTHMTKLLHTRMWHPANSKFERRARVSEWEEASRFSTWMKVDKSHRYTWVIANVWMGHGTHMNESRHTYGWVTAHVQISHVNSRAKFVEGIWDFPHEWKWMDHTDISESLHTYEWILAQVWMSHGTHMNKSRHTYGWVTAPRARSSWKASRLSHK